jgi:hypothetical protein
METKNVVDVLSLFTTYIMIEEDDLHLALHPNVILYMIFSLYHSTSLTRDGDQGLGKEDPWNTGCAKARHTGSATSASYY